MALHPFAVKSSSKDFQSLGTEPGDVLEIEEGPNQGSYIIRAVVGGVLFLEDRLPTEDAGPVKAVIRPKRLKTPQLTAAIVISQPQFNVSLSINSALQVMMV